jgi:hypothetical protein
MRLRLSWCNTGRCVGTCIRRQSNWRSPHSSQSLSCPLLHKLCYISFPWQLLARSSDITPVNAYEFCLCHVSSVSAFLTWFSHKVLTVHIIVLLFADLLVMLPLQMASILCIIFRSLLLTLSYFFCRQGMEDQVLFLLIRTSKDLYFDIKVIIFK